MLLGIIQSDNIEARFGWYRQLSGANYFICMKQLEYSERKIRAISLLKFSGFHVNDIDNMIEFGNSSENESLTEEIVHEISSDLMMNFMLSDQDFFILTYVCGACAHSIYKTKKCESCKLSLVSEDKLIDDEDDSSKYEFLRATDRGGLLFPLPHVLSLGECCWKIFKEIKSSDVLSNSLFRCPNSRLTFCKIAENLFLENNVEVIGRTMCSRGHNIIYEMCQRLYNCFLKNHVQRLSIKCRKPQTSKCAKFSGR